MTRLSELSVGRQGRVRQITGNDALSLRLMEMGLVPGTEVKLIGTAPLGDPFEVEVSGYHLSVRRSEADRVELEG